MKSGAVLDPGRVARARCTAYRATGSAIGTRRTSCWYATMSGPVTACWKRKFWIAVVVRTTGWLAADPIASLLVTLLVVRSAWRLVRESVDVLLEATPAHISLGRVREGLQSIGGVESVHDLHVWTVTSGMVAMSAHAVVREPAENQKVLESAIAAMRRLGIAHVTLQVERDRICETPCP